MVANPASFAGEAVPQPGCQRGGALHRLGCGQPDRPRARRLRRPGLRGRPRLHRRGRLRRLLAAGQRRRRGAGGRRRPPRLRPRRCRPGPWPRRARGEPDVHLPDGFVTPAYRDRSLADVLPAVGPRPRGRRRLRPERRRRPGWSLPEAQKLRRVPRRRARLRAAPRPRGRRAVPRTRCSTAREPATVGVPSTTATSLTSLGTGAAAGRCTASSGTPPASRAPTTLLNALMWSKDVDPHQWQPHPTAFARLAAAGVHTTTVNKREFAGSGLTEASTRGAEFVGADRLGERLVAVQAASAPRPVADLHVRRRPRLDRPPLRRRLGAVGGAAADDRPERRAAARDAAERRPHRRGRRPRDGRRPAGEPARRRGPPGAAGRRRPHRRRGAVPALYCRGGAVDDVVATWRTMLGDRAEVLHPATRRSRRGWFGERRGPRCVPRIGDVVVACRGDAACSTPRRSPTRRGWSGCTAR